MPAQKVPSKANAKVSFTADEVVAQLRSMASSTVLEGYERFAIPKENALGIPVGDLRKLAKPLQPNHSLAEGLWRTGIYEARLLATMVEDARTISPAQMDRWCRDFDNWAICDTACFGLFDRTSHAWEKVKVWAENDREFIRRGAFATLWGLTVHDKQAANQLFLDSLTLIEKHSDDDRNFVKKAVNMALRAIGKRNSVLHLAAIQTAQRLADSKFPAARWNGKDALRELKSESVHRRLALKLKGKS